MYTLYVVVILKGRKVMHCHCPSLTAFRSHDSLTPPPSRERRREGSRWNGRRSSTDSISGHSSPRRRCQRYAIQYKVEDLARFFVCALLVMVVVVVAMCLYLHNPQWETGAGGLVVSFTRLVCTGLHQPLQDVFYVYPKSHFLNTVVCWQHCYVF